MATDFAELTALFKTLISERFDLGGGADPGDPRLCFSLGTPLPDDGFRFDDGSDYFPLRAQEFMSHHCNVAPRIVDTVFLPTIGRIDELYSILLAGASPATAADTELLGAVKQEARSAFDVVLGSTIPPGLGKFRPTHATPDRWFDQDANDNWATISLAQAPPPPPPPPSPPPSSGGSSGGGGLSSPFPQMFLPVDEDLARLLAEPISVQSVAELQAGAKLGVAASGRAEPFENTHFSAALARVLIDPDHVSASDIVSDERFMELAALPLEFAGGAPITSRDFSLTAEICLVDLRRPWLSSALLALDNWFVASFDRGELASGADIEDGSPLSAIPVSCVLMRRLAIKANWTDADRARSLGSSHIGPFSLAGRRFDTATASLAVPGMQSIAWICQRMPALPPRSAIA